MRPCSNDCTQSAACRRFPVVIVLNQPIVRQGESRLGDWLPQKRIKTRKKCIALLQTHLQGELKTPAECRGLPSLDEDDDDDDDDENYLKTKDIQPYNHAHELYMYIIWPCYIHALHKEGAVSVFINK